MTDDEVKRALGPTPDTHVSSLSTKELLSRITEEATALAKKEFELAKAELRQNVTKTKTLAEGLGAAALLTLFAVNTLLVTAILALAKVMPAWGAGLLVSGILLAAAGVAGAIGWSKRVRTPMEKTRRHVKEDVKWVKERMA